MNLGEKIKIWRENKNLSQEQLAALIGVSRQSVYMWERGASEPSLTLFLKMCEVFETDPNKFLGADIFIFKDQS